MVLPVRPLQVTSSCGVYSTLALKIVIIYIGIFVTWQLDNFC